MPYRNEYPRPQFVRDNWTNLNGEWKFAFDDQDAGIRERWFENEGVYDQAIQVPYVYQSARSGIHDRTPHDIVWYCRTFMANPEATERILLHLGAVDYETDVFVNGMHVCHHIGGHTPIEADITDYLHTGQKQLLSVRAKDPHDDETIPRGKQFWEEKPRSIWYPNSTGIWQTVWLETVCTQHIRQLFLTPVFDAGRIRIEAELSGIQEPLSIDYEITFAGQKAAGGRIDVTASRMVWEADLYQEHIFRTGFHGGGWDWTPENPNLFDLKLALKNDTVTLDEVRSYFGMRKIEAKNGLIYLNNRPYYQKLVLDQGYWPDGLLTAPADADYEKDIRYAKDMGFNGCRKHQKTEDPRFLYHADKLGFIVWGECASPPVFSRDCANRLLTEWPEIIRRDYNHPCILTWVPINESWGVPNIVFDRTQQHFSQALYHCLHTLDPTRPVISNDGWAATETDIVAIHNYSHGAADEPEQYECFKETLRTREHLLTMHPSPWPVFAEHFHYQNQPVLLTECGGISYNVSGQDGWGYTSAESEADFIQEYKRVIDALYASDSLCGFCYTQITDVEQEMNGLLTYDRKPKCSLQKIREINEGYRIPAYALPIETKE